MGVAAVRRAVPSAKPVPVAPSGVRLAEPGELTLITLPLLSNAKLFGAAIVEGSVSVAGWIDQSFVSSSAMNPSLNSAPGASSVRKRKLSSAQLTPAGTVRLTRRPVRSLTPARGPGLASVLPFSCVSAPAGSTCSVSPDDRTANVVPSCGKSENGLSATAAGLPKGASCANEELATAPRRSPASSPRAGRRPSASASRPRPRWREGRSRRARIRARRSDAWGEASGPRPLALPPGGWGGAARSAHEHRASGGAQVPQDREHAAVILGGGREV